MEKAKLKEGKNMGNENRPRLSRRDFMKVIGGVGAAVLAGEASKVVAADETETPVPTPENPEPVSTKIAEVSTPGADKAVETDFSSVEGSNADGFNSIDDAIAFIEQNYTFLSRGGEILDSSAAAISKGNYSDPELFIFQSKRTREELKCVIAQGADRKYYIISLFGKPFSDDKLSDASAEKGSSSIEIKSQGSNYIVTIPEGGVTNIDETVNMEMSPYGTVIITGKTIWPNGEEVLLPLVFVNQGMSDGMVAKSQGSTYVVGGKSQYVNGYGSDKGVDPSAYTNDESVIGMVKGGEYFIAKGDLKGIDISNPSNWPVVNGLHFLGVPIRLTQGSLSQLSAKRPQ